MLRKNRIRSYVLTRTLNEECVGSSIYSLETYLIIDNATESDAGTYEVTLTPQLEALRGHIETGQVNVTIGKLISDMWICGVIKTFFRM